MERCLVRGCTLSLDKGDSLDDDADDEQVGDEDETHQQADRSPSAPLSRTKSAPGDDDDDQEDDETRYPIERRHTTAGHS